ncbi:gliding motility-associated C-terminal domain-containing protein, partial [Flavobacterium pectinovorum]|uniref:gliding motility-associated C-terminal domain-containing protein n=1 Tax=Flavobacterium pectinovorum TaxID=29533 RepID=UPI001FAC54D4
VQPTCAIPTGTITIASQTGMEYSLNGTTYQTSNIFAGLAPNNYTLYVRNNLDGTCATNSGATTVKISTVPTAPSIPTTLNVVQPTCAIPTGTITIASQTGMEYSLNGTTYQTSNIFAGLAPNNYTLYVRNTLDGTCATNSGTTTVKINPVPTAPSIPTTSSVVQPTCAIPTGTITIASQTGMEYSLNGTTYQTSNIFAGLAPNNYTLYIRNTLDGTCATNSGATTVKINPVPTAPSIPTASNVVQPTCAIPTGTITIASQTGMEYSLNGTTYQTSNVFAGLTPNNYTLYVRNTLDGTCSITSTGATTINTNPLLPVNPTVLNVIQPTCNIPFGTIEIVSMPDVEYSIGNGYQNNPVFSNLVPANYKISVRNKNNITCETFGSDQLINVIPSDIQFESSWTCQSNKYEITASPLSNSYDPTNVEYIWKDKNENIIGTNSKVLNVTDVVNATAETETFPLVYNLTIKSNTTGCETTSGITIESIYCEIQKGISPDGNGLNDFFDLRLMEVKKLEIFNRYGIRVYNQSNYTDQWNGQSNNGEALPSATYYYVIEFNNGESKTGWIYLIRDN